MSSPFKYPTPNIKVVVEHSAGFRNSPESPSESERRYFNLKVVAHKPLLAKMTPSRSPGTASATFQTAKQKEEKDLFPYVSVPRFDTSLTLLNEKRSTILNILALLTSLTLLNEKRSASILSIV